MRRTCSSRTAEDVVADIDAAISTARTSGSFTTFAPSDKPASPLADAPPSWHDAHAMGLDGNEIITMFRQTSVDALRNEGIAETFRGTKGPKGK